MLRQRLRDRRCSGGIAQQLGALGGLTFFKDYRNNPASINADTSVGSSVGTFLATRSAAAPATVTNSAGLISLVTTSNTPRYMGGYYGTTGFIQQTGLAIEAVGTNLIPKSYTMNDATWTATSVTVADGATTDPSNIAGGSNAASLTSTGANGTVLLTTAVTGSTYSVYLKRNSGSGTIQITADSGSTYTTVTLTTSWRCFSIKATSASQTCGIKIVTSGDSIFAWGNQFENIAYATSFIPTTTVALTRGVETLTYLTSGNRTAAQETIFVKFVPRNDIFRNTGARVVIDTATKERIIDADASVVSGAVKARPNATDNTTVVAISSNLTVANISSVVGAAFQHASPYVNIDLDGTFVTYTGGDYTTNAWGTTMFIGSAAASNKQIDGLVQSVACYSSVLSSAQMTQVISILNSGGI